MSEFKVSITGAIKPGTDLSRAANQFSKIFKIEPDRALTLMQSGKPRVLARGLSRERAEKMLSALDRIGLDGAATPPLDHEPLPPLPVDPIIESSIETAHPSPSESPGLFLTEEPAPSTDTAGAATNANDPGRTDRGKAEQSDATDQTDRTEVDPPHIEQVPIGNGLQWLNAGFDLFKGAPIPWIVASVFALGLNGLLASIPYVGSGLALTTWPILFAGLMIGANSQYQNGDFPITSFLSGFGARPVQLAIVGLIYLASVVIGTAALGGALWGLMLVLGGSMQGATLTIVLMIAMLPPIMILFFAPSLVALNELSAVEAAKLSVSGGFQNVIAFVLYGIGCLVVLFIGVLLFGIGILVAFPIVLASIYAAYRDIFV